MVILIIIIAIFWGGLWFFVGRNNPDLKSVNKLVATGKLIWDDAGKLLKKVSGGKL